MIHTVSSHGNTLSCNVSKSEVALTCLKSENACVIFIFLSVPKMQILSLVSVTGLQTGLRLRDSFLFNIPEKMVHPVCVWSAKQNWAKKFLGAFET